MAKLRAVECREFIEAVVSGGCAPVFKGDELVGCYGISGGTSDQDEIMGRYAREKVGWAHKPVNDDMPPEVKEQSTSFTIAWD